MRLAHRRLDEKAAHATVTATAASLTPVEWPVSGDETVRRYGLNGRHTAFSVWSAPGVVPRIATTGIRPGDTIETYDGTGVVTRVGSIAGFYMLDGKETRWEVSRVIAIIPGVAQ